MQVEHNAEKFVVMGDAHLLQSYIGAYDPIRDFENVFQKITKLSPDFILIAGDMFDKRKTETSDVRHPEGEAAMMKIREIFDNIEVPIYAICGNHEDERVLQGLQQTVKDFHYLGDSWESLEALINADQSLSALADEALMNSYTIIAFSIAFPSDQNKAKKSMALSKEQKEMLSTLKIGQYLVKLGGRHVHRF